MNRDARAVLTGLGVVLTAWLVLRGLPQAVASMRTREVALEQRADLLTRSRMRVARVADLDDSIRALNEVAATLPAVLLVGRESETAAVDLMRRMREVLGERPALLSGFERRSDSTASGPLVLTAVDATFETDFRELTEIVRLIESDPAIGIEAIEAAAVDPHAAPDLPERLSVRLGVSGWYRPDSASVPTYPQDFAR